MLKLGFGSENGNKYDIVVSFYGLFKMIFQQQLIYDFTVINYLARKIVKVIKKLSSTNNVSGKVHQSCCES